MISSILKVISHDFTALVKVSLSTDELFSETQNLLSVDKIVIAKIFLLFVTCLYVE